MVYNEALGLNLSLSYIIFEVVGMRGALKNVTRINRNGDMWYTFIPKAIKQALEQNGFKLKDYVIWEDLRVENDKEAVIILRIVKAGENQ